MMVALEPKPNDKPKYDQDNRFQPHILVMNSRLVSDPETVIDKGRLKAKIRNQAKSSNIDKKEQENTPVNLIQTDDKIDVEVP